MIDKFNKKITSYNSFINENVIVPPNIPNTKNLKFKKYLKIIHIKLDF